jgi:hypothetical protein
MTILRWWELLKGLLLLLLLLPDLRTWAVWYLLNWLNALDLLCWLRL